MERVILFYFFFYLGSTLGLFFHVLYFSFYYDSPCPSLLLLLFLAHFFYPALVETNIIYPLCTALSRNITFPHPLYD